MTILRLYLRPGWPDDAAELPWALIDAQGRNLADGDTGPGAWPQAADVELILPAGRTLFTRVTLPPAARERQAELIGFALEERLANDPAANVYALDGKLAGGERAVAATEAQALRRAVAALRKLARAPDRIVPEEALLPVPASGGWTVACGADGWLVRGDDCVHPPVPQAGAALLLPRLMAEGAPERVLLLGDADAEAAFRAALPGWHGELSRGEAADWRRGHPHGGFDFASGDLAARRRWRQWAPQLRRIGLLAGVLLALQLVVTLGEAGVIAWRKTALLGEIRGVTQPWLGAQAAPGATAVPMLRQVDRLRLERGLPARDDALALMERLAAVAGRQLAVRELDYQAGRLTLKIMAPPAEMLERWRTQLAAQQLQLDVKSVEAGVKELTLSREP